MFDFHNPPKLPRGLEYEKITQECAICSECNGIVTKNSLMIRLSQRRRNVSFAKYFPSMNGICLNCAKEKLGLMCADIYNKAEADVMTRDEIEVKEPDSKKIILLDESLDALNRLLGEFGEYLQNISNIETDYMPQEEIQDDEKAEDSDAQS